MVTRLRRLAVVCLLGSTLAWRCGGGGDSDAGVDAGANQDGGPTDAGPLTDAGADGGGMTGAADAPCQMPSAKDGCVRIGGGAQPWYYEGWFCPSSNCSSGFCASRVLGGAGRCGANAAEIRDIVSSGEGKVLEGTLP